MKTFFHFPSQALFKTIVPLVLLVFLLPCTLLLANNPPTGTVTITGNAQVGQALSVASTLADADGLGAITYQWKRGQLPEYNWALQTDAQDSGTHANHGALQGNGAFSGGAFQTTTSGGSGRVQMVNQDLNMSSFSQGFSISLDLQFDATDFDRSDVYLWVFLMMGEQPNGDDDWNNQVTMTLYHDDFSFNMKVDGTDHRLIIDKSLIALCKTELCKVTGSIDPSGNLALYLNGSLLGTQAASSAITAKIPTRSYAKLSIGSSIDGNYPFYGSIKNFSIHNTTGLSSATIGGATGATYTLTQADIGKAITVTASYTDGASNPENTTSSATDAVTAPPNATPVITSNGGAATAAVSVPENQTFATDVNASDADGNATVSYLISGGADQAKFDLNATSGVLTFKTAPDYENPTDGDTNNTYVIEVNASDGTAWDLQAITVTVTDVTEIFKPTTVTELQNAVNLWVSDNATALSTYGVINSWDVSLITDMSELFRDKTNFNDDISSWDVSNVTDTYYMFRGASNFNQDLSSWDVSKVTSMLGMFYSASNFNQDLSNWDVSNVTNLCVMFNAASSFNQDLSNWDVSNVTSMDRMFYSASSFNGNISSWDVSKINITYAMFRGATSFNQDLSNWDVSSVSNMNDMFKTASSFNQDISDWNVSNVTNMDDMFTSANALSDANKGLIHASFSFNSNWDHDWRQFVVINDANFQTAVNLWFSNQADANGTYGHIKDWNVTGVTNMSNAFKDRTTFDENITGWDVSSVTSMTYMFKEANSFNGDITGWDVSSVTTMKRMFNFATNFNQDISAWNVSSVTSMNGMFYEATSFNQDISAWNVSSVTDMWAIFMNASAFNQNISAWNVSSVTSIGGMFYGATAFNQDISAWDIGSVTSMAYMFQSASSFNQDISSWDVSSVTNMIDMFKTASSFNQDISDWNVSADTNMTNMFQNANALSNANKGLIHASFSSNSNWTHSSWSAFVPNSTPVITSYGGGATASVNAPENQTFATDVNASDADGNATVSYLISGGADQAKFDLNATSGVLTFKTAPDYENPTDADTNNTYVVEVNASDGTAWDLQTITVTVTVTDVHESTSPPTQPTDGNQTESDQNGTVPNQPVDQNHTVGPPPVDNNNTQTDQNTTTPAPVDPVVTPYRPLPKTLTHEELPNGNYRLRGMILADGGSAITEVAFELADNMVFRNSTLHPATMVPGSPNFSATLTLEPGNRYHYRAVATNALGTTSGSPKRLTTPPSEARWWTNEPEIPGGWRHSPWLGAFRPYDNGWIYHAKLGWAYAHPDGSGGLWLWFRDHRWIWTQQGVFPYLWKHRSASWHYLLGTRNGQPVFYEWTEHAPLPQP